MKHVLLCVLGEISWHLPVWKYLYSVFILDWFGEFKIMGLFFPKNLHLPSFVEVEGLSLSCQEQGWRPINLAAHSADFQPMPWFPTPYLPPPSWASVLLLPESLFCETNQLAFPWHLSGQAPGFQLPLSCWVRILLCAFYFQKILDISHLPLSYFSPCRLMYLFISFYFSGVLGGIRDNHLYQSPRFNLRS